MPGVKRKSDHDGLGLCSTLIGENPSILGDSSSKKRKSHGSNDITSDVLLDKSILMTSLKDAGYIVKNGDCPNVLKEDQAIFLKKFIRDITTQSDYPENIEKIKETLGQWLDDEVFLVKCLNPTDTSVTCSTARSSKQDSLIRLLLNVDDIQPILLTFLLEKLAETSIVQEGAEETQSQNIPRLILSSMRWLDKMVDGETITEKMTEILTVTSRYQQVEVISALPEILPSQYHNNIAPHLQDMLKEHNALVSTIVDCLGNLKLNPDQVANTKTVLIDNMSGAKFQLSDLPVVVEFLLASISKKEECLSLVGDLRENLELTAKTRPSQRVGPSSAKQKDTRDNDCKKSIECIIMDKFYISMLTDKKMFDAWYLALAAVKDAEEMKPLDFLIMVEMCRNKQRRKMVEGLLKNMIKKAILTEELIVVAFEKHPAVLKQRMTTVTDIADFLITSPDKTVSEGPGKQIYVSAFITLGEMCQREIVSQLVTSVTRTDTALSVLTQLSIEHSDLLAKYGWYLIMLLDHVYEGMEVSKVRTMIGVLSRLAWRSGSSSSGQQIRDDIIIFVKKQVNCGVLQYKKMGIVGGVVSARCMVTADDDDNDDDNFGVPIAESSRTSKSDSLVLTNLQQEAWELLEFINSKTANFPELAGLFIDEMCISFIDHLNINNNFIEKFKERFATNVEKDYVEDVVEMTNENFDLKMSCEMLLDDNDDVEDSEKAISLTLATKVQHSLSSSESSSSFSRKRTLTELSKLMPSLRLLIKTITLSNNGDLDDVDALLGCGIWLFPQDIIDNISDLQNNEKTIVLTTLFYAINWFTELINGFSSQNDQESRRKVLIRLKQILHLRKSLQTGLKSLPTFRPPTVLFSEDTSDWTSPLVAIQNKKNQKSGEKKGKKSKQVPTETMMNATMNLNTQRTTQVSQAKVSQKAEENSGVLIVDLQGYRPFFRELDLSCLNILKVEPVTTSSTPDLAEEIQSPSLRLPELLFLLQDLQLKLDKVFSNKKRGFPGKQNLNSIGYANISSSKPSDIVSQVSECFKYLFAHIDEVKAYFERLESMNDESVDLITTLKDTTSLTCLDIIKVTFQSLTTFFSWPGFSSSVHDHLLKTALYNIANRLHNDISDRSETSLLVSVILKYLKSFSVCCLSIDVAAAHVSLMSSLAEINDNKDMGLVAKVAETYLQKSWKQVTGEEEKGSVFNAQIEKLLQIYICNSSKVLKDLHKLCFEGTAKAIEKVDVEMFPVINRATVGTVYKVLLDHLVKEVKKMTYGSTKDADLQFSKWDDAVSIFVKTVLDLKTYVNRNLLRHVLQHARPFIDHFIKEGMTLVEKNLKKRPDEYTELIKTLQKGTRYLQNICGHAKISQDVALSSKVPFLKKSLETLVITVKAVLAANNCSEAFEMGTLKNKDLKGEEIFSQQQEEDSEEEAAAEEGEDEDGEDDDESLDNEDREDEVFNDMNDISEEI